MSRQGGSTLVRGVQTASPETTSGFIFLCSSEARKVGISVEARRVDVGSGGPDSLSGDYQRLHLPEQQRGKEGRH